MTRNSVRFQLMIAFLLVSIGIVIAIGLPVVLLMDRQEASQTRQLMNQAVLTTQASLDRERSDLQNLALLISQRPTLKRLLEGQDTSSLNRYLETLRESVNLDLLLVCNASGEVVGASSDSDMSELCSVEATSGFLPASQQHDSLMFATGDVQGIASQFHIFLGKEASSVLSQLQQATGLLYMLSRDGQIIASSGEGVEQSALSLPDRETSTGEWVRGSDGKTYTLADIPLSPDTDLDLDGALNVDEQVQAQGNLRQALILGLVFVVVIAFGLGLWLSRRISSPLARLANVAADFSRGNLRSPVVVQSSTWEISQLANTLEDARVALQHSMEQLQSEKAWVEQLLNTIVEGILTMDSRNHITFASAGMSRIAEQPGEGMIGQRIDHIFLPVDGEVPLTEQLPAVGQQQSILVRLRNGQEKLLSVSRAKLVPPETRSSSQVLVLRDVSNEETIHRLLGDFLANITHEFRTPLAALEASSELLLDNLHRLSPFELEELLLSLYLGIIDLQTLIDNLIEAASIEAGRFKVSRQPVPFSSILGDSLRLIQPLAEKYNLRLEAASPGEQILVVADHRRTVQVLVNLLSNAIKHSPEGGCIRVEYMVNGKHLRVEVMDEGSGIPIDQRSILFKRFGHIDSPDGRARQGAGLGLSVVKAIVEAQGGQVGIMDRLEQGASFWFTLPLADQEWV